MSEDPTPYAGHTALCAPFERGAAWEALALALLTEDDRRILLDLVPPFRALPVRVNGTHAEQLQDLDTLERLTRLGLLQHEEPYMHRLTPFGAEVAAALGEG